PAKLVGAEPGELAQQRRVVGARLARTGEHLVEGAGKGIVTEQTIHPGRGRSGSSGHLSHRTMDSISAPAGKTSNPAHRRGIKPARRVEKERLDALTQLAYRLVLL